MLPGKYKVDEHKKIALGRFMFFCTILTNATAVQRLVVNAAGEKRPVKVRRAALKWLLERVQNGLLDWQVRSILEEQLQAYDPPLDDDTYNYVLNNLPELVTRTLRLVEYQGIIDYDEMVWLPYVLKCNTPEETYEWLFLDEAQDLNPAQLDIVRKVLFLAHSEC